MFSPLPPICVIHKKRGVFFELCGLVQVWTGALFLADLVLSLRADLSNTTILELGSGGGLLAVVLSKVAKRMIATDANNAVLIKCLVRSPDFEAPLHADKTYQNYRDLRY